MKISIIGAMKSHIDQNNFGISNENMPYILEDLKRISGAEAGICYMNKPYFNSYVSDPEKALNRFSSVAGTGHHSIAGHAQIAVLFEGLPKIIAMYLNNLNDYETSEKSGRYTVMDSMNESEVELYNKWRDIFEKEIRSNYEVIDEKTVKKLAMENARYLLSVFMPVTMGYTASLRQWNYIIDWAKKYTNSQLPNNYFFNEIKRWMTVLYEQLKELFYVEELRDFKGLFGFDMINPDTSHSITEQYGRVYDVKYNVTFAVYAHLQRHRTIDYTMYFDGISSNFYIPKIIRNTPLEKEWLKDISSVSEFIPSGTLVCTEECGRLDKFFLKSMERNCGRAMLETMDNTFEVFEKFRSNYNLFQDREKALIDAYSISDKPKMKGQMLLCKEPCIWGCIGARNRKI